MSNPLAGWYPDPASEQHRRYWSGTEWTDHVEPLESKPAPGVVPEDEPVVPVPEHDPVVPVPEHTEVTSVTDHLAEKRGSTGVASGVMLVVVGVFVLLVVLFVALLVSYATSSDDDAESATSNDGVASAPAIDDVVWCEFVEEQEIVLEVVNQWDQISGYELTVAFFDDAGAHLGDQWFRLDDLRPGERSIELYNTFGSTGDSCEVVEAERSFDSYDPDYLADVSECTVIMNTDVQSEQAVVQVTNSSPDASDYLVHLALVDSEGIRRAFTRIDVAAVPSGESDLGEVLVPLAWDTSYRCDVVNAFRVPS